MYELSVRGRFSAAHRLGNYTGSCAAVHGHNWDVEVFVRGTSLDAAGLLIDFRDMKRQLADVLRRLDHADLNVVPPFREQNPSSEHIARHLFDEMSRRLNRAGCRVARVSVRETPESCASYLGEGEETGRS